MTASQESFASRVEREARSNFERWPENGPGSWDTASDADKARVIRTVAATEKAVILRANRYRKAGGK